MSAAEAFEKRTRRRVHTWVLAPCAAFIVAMAVFSMALLERHEARQYELEQLAAEARAAVLRAERAEREAMPAVQQTVIRVIAIDAEQGVITVALSGVKARECPTTSDTFTGWLLIDGQWKAQAIVSHRAMRLVGEPHMDIRVPQSALPVSFGEWQVGDIRVPPQDVSRISHVRVTVQHDCPLEDGRSGSTQPVSTWGAIPVSAELIEQERAP